MKKIFCKSLYISTLFILFSVKVTAQIQWEKSYGGSLYETANSIIQTNDGGYIVFGQDSSCDGDIVRACGGSYDLWIVKLSSAGVIQWQKSLGGSGDEEAYQIIQTKDKGYALAAITFSSNVPGYKGGGSDAWVLKLDSMGVVQWKKCFGGTGLDEATSIAQTKDGGYIVGGNSVSNDGDVTGHHGTPGPDSTAKDDMWVLKLDSLGTLQWQISVGGTDDDGSNSILQAKDGGYMVVGNSKSLDGDLTGKGNKGYNDWMVVKLTPAGTLSWVKLYGGSAQDDAANSITKANDGGYIIAGADGSTDGDVTGHHGPPCTAAECVDNDVWVIKIDSVGNLKWQKSFGGTGNDNCFSVSNTTDGGYVLGAFSLSNDGNVTGNHGLYDFWAAKIDSLGSLKWQQSLGGTGNDQGFSMQQTSDGGYIFAGTSESNDGNVTGNHGTNLNSDIWVVKLGSVTGIDNIKNSFEAINIYPNPTSDVFYIDNIPAKTTINVYDINGRLVISEKTTLSKYSVNVSSLQSGVYLVEISNGNTKEFKRVLISK
jgi:hypothetical protein